MAYEGVGREIVARLKYRNARCVVPWLAAEMASLVDDPAMDGAIDVVVPVPTTTARRRQRGFDQGRVLAVAVARRLGLPCRALLRRRSGPPQTGRPRTQRLLGPAFDVRGGGPVPPHVLLVDDVVTTGATLTAAARVLADAGAREVRVVVAARRA
ncbi:MAG: ComF family protein [Actinomycetota bacterium]|nr:ComF family protein [Actinomycetota bacterium]MDQ3575836.1 ComF family protein [Actinomycetota bacterium]